VKRTLAALTCAVSLVAGLTACGGEENKAALPRYTGGSSPSSTVTSSPPAAARPKETGPVALVAHSTYTYGALTLVVNLPAHIPGASLPGLRLFSEFLQSAGRTTARNKLDPAVSRLASANVVKSVQGTVVPGSVQGIGSVTYTVRQVRTGTSGFTMITGCLDQSKLVQVHKDGAHYGDPSAKKYPKLKMTADVSPGPTGRKVTSLTFPEPC